MTNYINCSYMLKIQQILTIIKEIVELDKAYQSIQTDLETACSCRDMISCRSDVLNSINKSISVRKYDISGLKMAINLIFYKHVSYNRANNSIKFEED